MLPALSPEAACELYRAFLGDLFERMAEARIRPTLFYSGKAVDALRGLLPGPWPLVAQPEGDLGVRMRAAIDHLLTTPDSRAVLIGSDSPDLPLIHIRHAFQRLKHRDVVLGPAMDGGYYLVGVREQAPALFADMPWGEPVVFEKTVEAVQRTGRSVSVLPPWYDVDDESSLRLLRSLCTARRLGGGVRLPRTERFLASI